MDGKYQLPFCFKIGFKVTFCKQNSRKYSNVDDQNKEAPKAGRWLVPENQYSLPSYNESPVPDLEN